MVGKANIATDGAARLDPADAWCRRAVIPGAYVRSFRDSDGHGQGGLRGLIGGMDCLAALGVVAVWLTPVSPSPNIDSGCNVWADPRPDSGPPNTWLGRFGGFAWEWNSARRQYHLHNFRIEQPDLNLHNPAVQDEILRVMPHRFDPGVGGLPLNVVNFDMQDPSPARQLGVPAQRCPGQSLLPAIACP